MFADHFRGSDIHVFSDRFRGSDNHMFSACFRGSDNHTFSDRFRGSRSSLFVSNLRDIRSKIWPNIDDQIKKIYKQEVRNFQQTLIFIFVSFYPMPLFKAFHIIFS